MKGYHATPRRQRGASTVETAIMAMLLFTLLLGAFQGLLLYRAKITLNHAVTEAARTGAVNHAQSEPMTTVMAEQLSPLYGGWGTAGAEGLAKSILKAKADLKIDLGKGFDAGAGYELQILSPTVEAFEDFGEDVDGTIEIPNHHLRSRERTIGSTSKVNVQDANLLKIRATYGYKLSVPIAGDLIASILKVADPDRKHYYEANPPRLPLTSTAVGRMQSAPRVDAAQLSIKTALKPAGAGTVPPEDFTEEEAKEQEEKITNPGGPTDPTDPTDPVDPTDPTDPVDEVQCETTWDDDEYSFKDFSLTNIFTWDDAYDAASNIIADFTKGLVQGVGDQANDLIELLKDPTVLWDMAKSIYENGIQEFFEQILEGLVEDLKKLRDCGPGDIGRIIGQNVNPAVFVKVISKMAKITGNAKLAKYADNLELPCKIRASFLGGTWVSTPSGMRRIEDIMAGDLVLSRSSVDDALSAQPVTALLGREAPNYHLLNTSVGTIRTTAEHPFWVINKGWTSAKDLQANDRLSTAKGEALLFENGFQNEKARVYNFTVANSHTYFVAASQNGGGGLWVHNAGKATCWDKASLNLDDKARFTDLRTGRTIYEVEIDSKLRRVYVGRDGRIYDYDVHKVDFHGLTKKELDDFNDRIRSTPDDIVADNIRWERYELNQAKLGKTPPPLDRDTWQIKADQVRKNQKIGRDRENSARDALSDQLGEKLNDNNTGSTCKTRCNDNSSRPDSMSDNYVHEHKHLGGKIDTVYDTKQMETQRDWAKENGRQHVVTISSDKPLGSGPPNVKPSGPLAKSGSDIHYFDADTGKISHTWDKDEGGWVEYGS